MLEPNFPIILHVWVVLRIVVEADAVRLSAHRWTFATVSDLAQWVTFEFAGTLARTKTKGGESALFLSFITLKIREFRGKMISETMVRRHL